MNYKKIKLKEGINLHTIKTDKFKTNLIALFLTTPLSKEDITKNALIPMVLRRGSKALPNIEEMNNKLDEMYGADFNCGVDKTGDNQILKFYMESINNEFLPENEDLLKESIEVLLDIVFNPLIENNEFNNEYVKSEKENLKQIIQGKKDNKAQYAYERCIEEMYRDKPFGLYKYGYIEDLEKIDAKNLYEYYRKLISECKIDIFVSGDIEDNIQETLNQNKNIEQLVSREAIYNKKNQKLETTDKEKTINEKMEVSQGKIVLGLEVKNDNKESQYASILYNTILGGSPTSKMFQNVREKAHLAYVAGSNYIRHKNNIFVRCGIEIENYEKALNLIKVQIDDMKNGNFTDEDLENAKTAIISTIRAIPEEQDSEITYYFGQEIAEYRMEYDEYENRINKVNKQDIIDVANTIKINTIYFLN